MTPAIPIMVNIVLYNILLLQFFARLEMFHAVRIGNLLGVFIARNIVFEFGDCLAWILYSHSYMYQF